MSQPFGLQVTTHTLPRNPGQPHILASSAKLNSQPMSGQPLKFARHWGTRESAAVNAGQRKSQILGIRYAELTHPPGI